MAYGQTQQRQGGNNFAKGPRTGAPAAANGSKGPKLSFVKVFKNKSGNGYSTIVKEDILIPAGTKLGVFEDTLKGKDGTEYQVLNIKKMPERAQA